MKKLLVVIFMCCIICFSSCGITAKGITIEESEGYTKVVLDNFSGEAKFEIKKNSNGECGLYYYADITKGNVTVYYDQGWLWDEYKLFTSDVNSVVNGGGEYIDNSTSKITIIIKTDTLTSGEILLGFNQFE